MLVIDNQLTADDYTAALTLESNFGGRLVYIVANQSVYARFRPLLEHGGSDTAAYGPQTLLTPQSSFIDKISGVQFRSAIAGTPARIIAQLSEPGDVLPASGTPFTQVLQGSGGVGATGEAVLGGIFAAGGNLQRANAAYADLDDCTNRTSFGTSLHEWPSGLVPELRAIFSLLQLGGGTAFFRLAAKPLAAGADPWGTAATVVGGEVSTASGTDTLLDTGWVSGSALVPAAYIAPTGQLRSTGAGVTAQINYGAIFLRFVTPA